MNDTSLGQLIKVQRAIMHCFLKRTVTRPPLINTLTSTTVGETGVALRCACVAR